MGDCNCNVNGNCNVNDNVNDFITENCYELQESTEDYQKACIAVAGSDSLGQAWTDHDARLAISRVPDRRRAKDSLDAQRSLHACPKLFGSGGWSPLQHW